MIKQEAQYASVVQITKFLLRAEVARSEIPSAVLVSINQVGYCLLDEYEIQIRNRDGRLLEQH
jgi:hypothetical protein